jgi:hypothetical protein
MLQVASLCLRSYDTRFLEWQNPLLFFKQTRRFRVLKSRETGCIRMMTRGSVSGCFSRFETHYYSEHLLDLIEQEIDQTLSPC